MTKLPQALHIGFSKAASTWLQDLFRQSEEVFLVYKTFFFSPLNSKIYKKGIDYYSSFFEQAHENQVAVESQEHIILPEIHPELKCATLCLESVQAIAHRIKSDLPDIKIILIIRNQEEMIVSRYLQYVVQGGWLRPEQFFDKLIFNNSNFQRYADYRFFKIIRILERIFGQNNLLVLLQEELFKKRLENIDKISTFLGCEINRTKIKKKNVGNSYYAIKLIRFLNQYWVRQVETIEKRTQTRGLYHPWLYVKEGIRKFDALMGNKKQKKRYLSEDQRNQLKEIFSSDNKKLEGYLDRSIKELGYYYN